MSGKAFESPLISHMRMRALYRALLEMRLLAPSLGRSARLPRGLEACWVATAIDLQFGDLTSDTRGTALSDYVRGVGQRANAGPARSAEVRKVLEATRKSFAGSPADRLLFASGSAMAIKVSGKLSVVMAYVTRSEMSPYDWRRVLRIAGDADLPLIIVSVDNVVNLPTGIRLPVIPVDGGDAVAIYRVAQECILRARSEGRAAVIQCMQTAADPITTLGEQLLAKRVCTDRWLAGISEPFRRVVTNSLPKSDARPA